MKYPAVMIVSTVQLDSQSDLMVHVSVTEGEGKDLKRTVHDFRIRPLDTPDDPEDYSRMAIAAVCEAL